MTVKPFRVEDRPAMRGAADRIQRVTIVGVDMPFGDMFKLLAKFYLASALFFFLGALISAFLWYQVLR